MTIGGMIAGMAVALLSGFVTRMTTLRQDASMGAFYLISLAAGVLIVSTKGRNVDLLHVLFGTVLALNNDAVVLLCSIAAIIPAPVAAWRLIAWARDLSWRITAVSRSGHAGGATGSHRR